MKKVMAFILALSMVFCLCACGGGDGGAANNGGASQAPSAPAGNEQGGGDQSGSSELAHWKLGMVDPGAWDATSGPLHAQMKLACEALNVELVYATMESQSAEGQIAAAQNLIASGCNGIIFTNYPLIYGCVPQVANLCDDAGVYWSLSWTYIGEGDGGNYEACVNSPYFVSTTFEDDVYSAKWCADILGEMGCKQVCEVGFPSGNATGEMRESGIQAGASQYGMTVLADERDISLTTTSDGGKTIMDRFITGYPDMDGLIIAGMSQFVLSGVVSSMEEHHVENQVSLTCIDFHEYQTEYLQKGILDGIIGGHVVGTFYSLILMANIMNGTPLTEEKVIAKDNFIELSSYEDAQAWDTYGKPGTIYSAEEIQNMMVKNNPDYTYADWQKMVADYSLADIVARANG